MPRFLSNISTSETEAEVWESVDLVIVWPTKLAGSPEIASAMTTSLRIYSAVEGLINLSSRSNTSACSPYNTLNNIRIDSAIPFDW